MSTAKNKRKETTPSSKEEDSAFTAEWAVGLSIGEMGCIAQQMKVVAAQVNEVAMSIEFQASDMRDELTDSPTKNGAYFVAKRHQRQTNANMRMSLSDCESLIREMHSLVKAREEVYSRALGIDDVQFNGALEFVPEGQWMALRHPQFEEMRRIYVDWCKETALPNRHWSKDNPRLPVPAMDRVLKVAGEFGEFIAVEWPELEKKLCYHVVTYEATLYRTSPHL